MTFALHVTVLAIPLCFSVKIIALQIIIMLCIEEFVEFVGGQNNITLRTYSTRDKNFAILSFSPNMQATSRGFSQLEVSLAVVMSAS